MGWRVWLTILAAAAAFIVFCSNMFVALADEVVAANTVSTSFLMSGSKIANYEKAIHISDATSKQKQQLTIQRDDQEAAKAYCNKRGRKVRADCLEARSLAVMDDYVDPSHNSEPPSRAPTGTLPKAPPGNH